MKKRSAHERALGLKNDKEVERMDDMRAQILANEFAAKKSEAEKHGLWWDATTKRIRLGPKARDQIAAALLAPLMTVGVFSWDAFVLMKTWNWHIVSLGAPALSHWHALGLTAVTAALVPGTGLFADAAASAADDKCAAALNKRTPLLIERVGLVFGRKLLCLVVAWIALVWQT